MSMSWDAAAGHWHDPKTGETRTAIDPVQALIETRGETHGDFAFNALYAQQLRSMFRQSAGWASMPAVHKEALDCVALKLSRILSGQSKHADHFRDIAGYCELALKACDD